MKTVIFVKVKPKSKEEKVERIDQDNFIVAVKAPPVEGLANRAVEKALADFFNVAPSDVRVTRGHQAKIKQVEINY